MSDEAKLGSAGEQPNRYNLTDWNGHGEKLTSPINKTIIPIIMPKKTQSLIFMIIYLIRTNIFCIF